MVIDLRSDTLTLPSEEMLRTVLTAPLGDSGRLDGDGYGCDPTVNALEDYAASLVGKERSLLALSGTMGNHIALLTWCRQGDVVLMDERQHIFRTEKATCDSRFGQLKPVFYHLTDKCIPDPNEIERLIKTEHPKLLCLENTHNSAGGVCIPVPVLAEMLISSVHSPPPNPVSSCSSLCAASKGVSPFSQTPAQISYPVHCSP